MKTLIILRPEIFSIIVMLFLVISDRYYAKFRSEKTIFFKVAIACLGHCIFALITEITVNMEDAPVWLNDICHIFFFLFSLLYSLFYLEYAVGLIIPNSKHKKRIMIIGYVLSIVSIIVMLVSPISYIQGQHLRYSAGIGPASCYILGFVFYLIADIVIVVNYKKINSFIVCTIIPLSSITLGLLAIQIIIPEFLISAEALTITAVGLFLSVENPIEKLKNRAYIDYNVQIWNRNAYENDMKNIIKNELEANHRLAFVICDVNGLKCVNDNLGHLEGDKFLEQVAAILKDEMKLAYRCYRIGGDEFLAVYFDKSFDDIKAEAARAEELCGKIDFGENIPVGISVGYAQLNDNQNINEMFRNAEKMMYENKKNYYKQKGFERRTD